MKQKIDDDRYQELEHAIWQDFFNNATQEELYHALLSSNWDSNDYFLDWIKYNPYIDKAIILAAYWMSEPYYAKQFKDSHEVEKKEQWYADDFEFIEEIEKRYCEGFYTKNSLECDPKNILHLENYDKSEDRTIINSNLKRVREIPGIMFQKLEGNKISPIDHYAYTEGLPNAYYLKIEQISEDYEIE